MQKELRIVPAVPMDWSDDGGPMEVKYKNPFLKKNIRSQFVQINIYTLRN